MRLRGKMTLRKSKYILFDKFTEFNSSLNNSSKNDLQIKRTSHYSSLDFIT